MKEARTYGRDAVVEVEVYSECKYTASEEVFENAIKVRYEISSWDIVDGEEAAEIESMTDESCIDDNHEYLVLHFTDGDEATFRNSYVDMFRVCWVR